MFQRFFTELRAARVPVSLKEYLLLVEALEKDAIDTNVEDFYYLSRAALVKDEKNLDKFDRVFGHVFKGLENTTEAINAEIPAEWLKLLTEKFLSDEEKAQIQALGGWDKLMETLKQRLEEQKERHEGGSKWIGTGGTSPYGNGGYSPEGVRIGGGDKKGQGRAVKVWDKREYKNLDDSVELGVRNIKIALRRLRKFARSGAPDELDLDGTIKKSAKEGYLDIVLRPERRNTIKVLLFLDIGGSMDSHIKLCEELFSAARAEFKHMEFFYFHNCLYESVWKDNRRRHDEKTLTWDVLHKFPHDYRIVFVGDATMSPYEITYPGGSVE
ncbi:MAG TPA: VWA domain-containing protein, partial [Hyphomonadaceae bacterium]|nr:VWA domain-containing protein [Hyphomonadaceae bacterium]